MALHQVRRLDRPAHGYFLLAYAPGQARIADCWIDSTDAADWAALAQLAVRAAREDPAIAEVVARSSNPALAAGLAAAGFRARKAEPIQLLTPRGADVPRLSVQTQLLDNDAAWLHPGRRAFWT